MAEPWEKLLDKHEDGDAPKHTYPSKYPPGTHWSTDAAWELLDMLPDGMISDDARAMIAGMIAGRLVRQHEEAQPKPAGWRYRLKGTNKWHYDTTIKNGDDLRVIDPEVYDAQPFYL